MTLLRVVAFAVVAVTTVRLGIFPGTYDSIFARCLPPLSLGSFRAHLEGSRRWVPLDVQMLLDICGKHANTSDTYGGDSMSGTEPRAAKCIFGGGQGTVILIGRVGGGKRESRREPRTGSNTNAWSEDVR